MFKFLKYFSQEIVQLLVGLDQHLHVDKAISHVHKEAEYYLLNKEAIKKKTKTRYKNMTDGEKQAKKIIKKIITRN